MTDPAPALPEVQYAPLEDAAARLRAIDARLSELAPKVAKARERLEEAQAADQPDPREVRRAELLGRPLPVGKRVETAAGNLAFLEGEETELLRERAGILEEAPRLAEACTNDLQVTLAPAVDGIGARIVEGLQAAHAGIAALERLHSQVAGLGIGSDARPHLRALRLPWAVSTWLEETLFALREGFPRLGHLFAAPTSTPEAAPVAEEASTT